MDTNRLANVIFDKGIKVPQQEYSIVCERISDDKFTLNEYVMEYKLKEQFMGKIAYLLEDGTRVLISEQAIRKINSLNINKKDVETFMSKDYSKFKQLIGLITHGSN